MKHRIRTRTAFVTVAAVVGASLLAVPATAQRPEQAKDRPGHQQQDTRDFNEAAGAARSKGSVRVIVGLPVDFRPEGDVSSSRRQSQRSEIAGEQQGVRRDLAGKPYDEIYAYAAIPYMALDVSEEAVDALRESESVSSIELDLAHRPTLAQSSPLVEADTMWSGGFTGAGTVVAILDTGVDKTHSFFGGRVVEEACYSSGAGSSDPICPGGGTSQTGPGSGVNCSSSIASCNHGTHVAGIAAGSGTTFHGVARGANIMSVQVFSRKNSGCSPSPNPCLTAWTSDIIKGMERVYALRATHNFAAVNLSLSGAEYSSACDADQAAWKAAIDNLLSVGIATAAATGNDSSTDSIGSPACVSTAVAVGSTTKQDAVSNFSNGHATLVDVLAPGSSINSSVPGGGFAFFNGTSMATPHVTGAFSLMKQRFPSMTVQQKLDALKATGVAVTDTRANPSFKTPRIRIAQASNLLDGLVYEDLGVPNFSVSSDADGGSPVVFTIPGGETEPGDVIGFSFAGTVTSGVSSNGSWASDTCMTVEAPNGTAYTVGGYSGATAGCNVHPWDFQGSVSSSNGTYESQHGVAYQPSVSDDGNWTITFTNDWNDSDAATIAWTDVTVTLHKLPADVPHTLGDYDGNATTDIAVYRPSTGHWFIKG
ncbi:MAG: S8 family serine peptidase, partial [Actinomycetota bacterium]